MPQMTTILTHNKKPFWEAAQKAVEKSCTEAVVVAASLQGQLCPPLGWLLIYQMSFAQ